MSFSFNYEFKVYFKDLMNRASSTLTSKSELPEARILTNISSFSVLASGNSDFEVKSKRSSIH